MTTQGEFAACERSDRLLQRGLGRTMERAGGRIGFLLALAVAAVVVASVLA